MSAIRSRKLVQRSRQNEDSPAPSRNNRRESQAPQRGRGTATRQSTALPPYEIPSCPLSGTARRELDNLRIAQDYAKYSTHIKSAKAILPNITAEVYERLRVRKEQVEKETTRRQKDGVEEKTEAEIEAEQLAEALEAKTMDLTNKTEKALRDIIDYGDELSMRDVMMKGILESIPLPPAPQPARNRRRQDAEDDEEEPAEEEEPEDEIPEVVGVSTIDLLRDAKEEYARKYASKAMRERYENTDYGTFVRAVHGALHGQDGPPVPHARTWFTQDGEPTLTKVDQKMDDANEDDESEDEVVIARASVNLKCPLTLQTFKEPYTNNVCKHSFEKTAIVDYHLAEAVVHHEPVVPGQPRPPPSKVVKCPQTGCNNMLQLKDFYNDTNLRRLVKRAEKDAAREDEDDEDDMPRGTQSGRPEEVDSEVDIDADEMEQDHASHIQKVKRERA